MLFVLQWLEPMRSDGELRSLLLLNNLAVLRPLSIFLSGLDGRDAKDVEMGQLRARSSSSWPWSSSSSYAEYTVTFVVAAIFGQKGGPSATSMSEAVLRSRRSSTLQRSQVVRPRNLRSGRRLRIFVGAKSSSFMLPDLSGFALRSPANSGSDALGLDCFLLFNPRVFSVSKEALSSNIRFFRASVVKGLFVNCSSHVCT